MKSIKLWVIAATLLCGTMAMQAQSKMDARLCMTYADFVAGKWQSVDSLVNGRTKQIIQLKMEDHQFKIKTGDKQTDELIKKDALLIEYDGHLYANCRNLRYKDAPLDVRNYAQAYRYDGDKLCIVAHWVNGGAVLAGLAGDVVATVSPLPVSIPTAVGSTVIWLNMEKLSNFRCYYLDSDANEKGRTVVERMTDEFMAKTLSDSPQLLERYNALDKKRARQSAANILPFLKEKGLIKE